MKLLYPFVCFCMLTWPVLGQNKSKVDSLEKVLKTDISDRKKVDVYIYLAGEYAYTDSAQVAKYTTPGIALARKINYVKGEASAYYYLGGITMFKGNYPKAKDCYNRSLKLSKTVNYLFGVGSALNGLATIHRDQGNYPKSINTYKQALNIYDQIKDKAKQKRVYNNRGVIYNNLGLIYWNQGNISMALKMYKQALVLFKKTNNKANQAGIYGNIGILYEAQGDHSNAMVNYQQSIKICEMTGNKTGIAINYGNIGVIYQIQGNYAKAMVKHRQSLKIYKEIGNKQGMAFSYDYLGDIYLHKRDFANAEKYIKKSLQISQQIGYKSGIAEGYLGLGQLALDQKHIKKAKEYFEQALALRQELGETGLEANTWINLGKAYYTQQKYKESLRHLQQGMKLATKTGSILNIRDGAAYLFEVYQALKQPQKALENHILFKKMTDSLLNKKNIRQIAQLEERFVAKKREDSIKVIQKNERRVLNAEIDAQKANQRSTVLGASLLGVLLLVLAFFYRSKQRSNQELNQANLRLNIANQGLQESNEELYMANEVIQESNTKINQINKELKYQRDHIIDSINYAQRIQKAILPLNEKMQKSLPPHFVFYKPRDIVSGDFYWFEEVGDKQIIIAADCTGHGVPGAFMTMLGSQALTNIIIQYGVHSPEQILTQLDQVLPTLLQSGTTQVEDGMDAVVCVIDKKAQQLHYAGAKNPLVFVQGGELKEIKGDRYGINNYREYYDQGKINNFTLHTIDISQPTTFFMYSDGYQDQFGGENGKKFMKTQFKELLHQIALQPVAEQKQLLESTLNEWMTYNGKKNEQIDDILVMGVKV